MVKIGPDWSRSVQIARVIQSGPEWCRVVQIGPDWSRLVQIGLIGPDFYLFDNVLANIAKYLFVVVKFQNVFVCNYLVKKLSHEKKLGKGSKKIGKVWSFAKPGGGVSEGGKKTKLLF